MSPTKEDVLRWLNQLLDYSLLTGNEEFIVKKTLEYVKGTEDVR